MFFIRLSNFVGELDLEVDLSAPSWKATYSNTGARRKVALAVVLVLAILGLHAPCLGFQRSQFSACDFLIWILMEKKTRHMGVSKDRGKTPQSIHFNRVFHYKPSILGYPYFWKHPYIKMPSIFDIFGKIVVVVSQGENVVIHTNYTAVNQRIFAS